MELLLAGIAGKIGLRTGAADLLHGLGEIAAAEHTGENGAKRHTALCENAAAVALRGVAGRNMTDLVGHHTSDLGFVLGQRHQPAGDVDIAARQREGVDHITVQKRERKVEIRQFRHRLQSIADLIDISLQASFVIGPAELLQNFRMLILANRFFLLRAHRRELALPGGGVDHLGAGAGQSE